MKCVFYFLLFLIICIIITYQGFACSRDDYKQITIKNQLGSYSLEYPSHYETNIRDDLEFKVPYTHLIFEGPVRNETVEVFDPETNEIYNVEGQRGTSVINVHVSNYKIYFGEFYSAADKLIDLSWVVMLI